MRKIDEEAALAIVFANTKRKKRTENLVTVAEAFERLAKLYGSNEAVGKKVGLSAEIVREFRKVLTLSPAVLGMVKARHIDRLDEARELARIAAPDKQKEAALEVIRLGTKEVRHMRDMVSRDGTSPNEAAKAALAAKLKGLHVFVLDFTDAEYRAILERARRMKTSPTEMVKQVIARWLQRRAGVDGKR
ncbi:MAG: hypothetical protein FJ276_34025 [Planctomycetes bacterium]|nr:hypothetical protein [Planctomycetota bacterium]